MLRPGKILRAFREAWGWTTRQVGDKSHKLAGVWGHPEYAIDSSSISRIENGETSIPAVSSGKMTALMEIYSKDANTLLGLIKPERHAYLVDDPLGGPNFTQLVREGRLAEKLSVILASRYPTQAIPEKTI
jgi:transcriptional regulator with XRE-family HTH domain